MCPEASRKPHGRTIDDEHETELMRDCIMPPNDNARSDLVSTRTPARASANNNVAVHLIPPCDLVSDFSYNITLRPLQSPPSLAAGTGSSASATFIAITLPRLCW